MKNRFSTLDIIAMINELQKCIGMRVNQVYDIDNKTYLIRLQRYEEKTILLLESGVRIHTTEYEWPKNPSPSGFSMKMRKHLKNKRLEKLNQLGMDRIVDLQFGINEAAYHIILELYDRGNIVLTDFEYTILNILRPRTTESEDVKFVVREKYPVDKVLCSSETFNRDALFFSLKQAKDGDSLKKLLLPQVAFGPALLDHVLIKNGFPKNCAINKQFKIPNDMNRLFLCLEEADVLLKHISMKSQGYIIQKVEKNKDSQDVITNIEFHPYLFHQLSEMTFTTYDTFDKAVDNFFSSLEGQKIDIKALQKEKEALKKLENVKKDHDQRVSKLKQSQTEDMKKALLIEMNSALVEKAITIIRSAIANQMSWSDIEELIKEAQAEGDPIAKTIKKLKLNINHFTLLLSSPLSDSEEDELKPQLVDIDLGCSAYANARKYYDMKRAHAKKEQKTLESSEKAFKSAEKKTKQTLKEVAVTTSITKARKVMWFEKFLWFISSENYLVIAGRDVQQNELLVKRYMKTSDLYVHADLHGASSVIIKNPLGGEVPPKTLNEAGTMAACYSSGWDAKIVTSAWWVHSHQVSKTAPSGEYLTTGSFMIRGKKNYLAPANLIMGFGFMFKLDEESILKHANERCEKSDDFKTADDGKEKDENVDVDNVSDDIEEMNNEDTNSDASRSDDDDKSVEEVANSRAEHVDVVTAKVENLEVKTSKNCLDTDDGDSVHKNDVQRCESLPDEDKTEEDIIDEVDEENNVMNNENTMMNKNSNPEIIAFPDTEVKFNVLHEDQDLMKKPVPKLSSTGVMVQEHKKKARKTQNVQFNLENSVAKEKCSQQKRGQKGKLKKIKEKYKDQDEEERQLRMSILASAGTTKEDKKSKNKKSEDKKSVNSQSKVNKNVNKVNFNEALKEEIPILAEEKAPSESQVSPPDALLEKNSVPVQKSGDKMNDASDEEAEDDTQVSDELKLLNSLTGCPHADDILLFSVPVCAPYTCMLNYKYKVKIIPGSHRRGKAAKTALNVFLCDKTATSREKDLLKCVKDQDISRNLPGKIKISAGNIKRGK
ncbi:ribosome quality control complex subunit NEMF-like [Uloborus diversus]|uniref:ribosome quality control complex subunit NEMF-like n=1 Tax=Uloborus diversus TaxID=327109 RepID=UPI00240A4C9D|nr:ribosome quality control complex subunit NEMF-like [Uloborus diversus]